MTNATVITLSDTERIVVDYADWTPDSPLDWEWDAGIYVIRQDRNSVPLYRDYQDQHSQLDTISINRTDAGLDYCSDEMYEPMQTHLRRAGLYVTNVTLYGSSQSQWWDAVVYGADETAVSAFLKTLRQYLAKEVYVVRHERLETYANVNDSTDTHTHWEPVDAIGDVYLDNLNDETAILDVLGLAPVK